MQSLWTDVDQYFTQHLLPADPTLDAARAANEKAGLPAIDVSPAQGKLLHLMARMRGAERILEIGTLGGYSTIWLARALPADGRLITLELEPEHARVARTNIERAGVADRVDLRLGPALDSLAQLEAEGTGPFDFVFIDADKENIPHYFDRAVGLCRPGSAIVVDNVVRKGEVVDEASEDERVQAVRRFVAGLPADSRVSATVVQTVGAKGYDGFILAVVG